MRRAVVLMVVLLAGCSVQPTPTPEGWTPPPPTATPTAPATATPTATPVPPTATPTPFESICDPVHDPDCHEDVERFISPIAWFPTLDSAGVFRTEIQVNDGGLEIVWPPLRLAGEGERIFAIAITFYQDDQPIATIYPPVAEQADWDWSPERGVYVGDTFRLTGESLVTVEAVIDPRLGEAADVVCVWNGKDLLDCTELEVVIE